MRSILRPLTALLLAIGAVSCTDLGTAPAIPAASRARVAFAPRFSAAAAQARRALSALGADADRVRIVLVRQPNDTLKDTTVVFTAGEVTVTVDLVVAAVAGEVLRANLRYQADTVVLFTGSADVTVRPLTSGTPAPPDVPPVTLIYVAPDASAARLDVAPNGASFASLAPVQMTVAAFDSSNALLASVHVTWATSDTTIASISRTGLLQFTGRPGSVIVSATTPLLVVGRATLTFAGAPAAIAVVSGDAQRDTVHRLLAAPLVVVVRDGLGNPVAGATVQWSRTAGAGTLGAATSVTGSDGRASVAYTLGATAGTESVQATVSGVSGAATFTAVAVNGPASVIALVSGDNQTAAQSSALPLPLVVHVTDADGNNVAFAVVTWTSSASTSPTSSTTDAAGNTGITITTGPTAGTFTVTAALGSGASVVFHETVTGPVTVPITAGFATLKLSPNPVSMRVGDTIVFSAVQVNADGTTAAVTPTWATNAPGRLSIDGAGQAIAYDTGTVTVTASSAGIVGHATVTVLPAPVLQGFGMAPTSVSGTSTTAQSTTFTVDASDEGSGVSSVQVALTSPDGTVTRTCSTSSPVSGTRASGEWSCTMSIPAGSQTGDWHVTTLTIAGTITRSYKESALSTYGTTTLTVNP